MVVEKSKKLFTYFFYIRYFYYHIMHSEVEYLFAEKYWDWSNGTYNSLWWFQRRSQCANSLFFYFFKSNRMLSNCAENHLKIFTAKISFTQQHTKKNTELNLTVHITICSISFLLLVLNCHLPRDKYLYPTMSFNVSSNLHLLCFLFVELCRASCNLINSYANGFSH